VLRLVDVQHNIAEALVRSPKGEDTTGLAAALSMLATNDETVARLVEGVLADPPWSERVAANSYLHENGFYKLVLADSGTPPFKLRLHSWLRWRTDDEIVRENIHNHRWNFATVLVRGAYTFQQFVVRPGGQTYHKYNYSSPGGTGAYCMEYVGSQDLVKVLDMRLGSRCSYEINHTVLHRAVQDENDALLTLMLQGGIKKSKTAVYSVSDLGQGPQIPAQSIGHQTARQILTDVLRRLAS
jgi:hypothetical protein